MELCWGQNWGQNCGKVLLVVSDVWVAFHLLAWRFRCWRGASVVGVALQLLAWRFSCWRGASCSYWRGASCSYWRGASCSYWRGASCSYWRGASCSYWRSASVIGVALQLLAWRLSYWRGANNSCVILITSKTSLSIQYNNNLSVLLTFIVIDLNQ